MKIADVVVGEHYVTTGEPWGTSRWLPDDVAVVCVEALEVPPLGGYLRRQARLHWVRGRRLDDPYLPANHLICAAAEWEAQIAVQKVVAARVDEQVAALETRAAALQLQLASLGYQDVVITIAPSYEDQAVRSPTTVRSQYELADLLLAAFVADASNTSAARVWERAYDDIHALIDIAVELGISIRTDTSDGWLCDFAIFSDLETLERVTATL